MAAVFRLMLVHLDTSILIDAFTGRGRSMPKVVAAVSAGDVLTFSTIVLYEWLRGPRTKDERSTVATLFSREPMVPFAEREAETAARLFKTMKRSRQRQADLAIAACAIEHAAALWTLNPSDFDDIPDLRLYRS